MAKKHLLISYLLLILFHTPPLLAEDGPNPFYPNWKLLKQEEKTQFIAGYLRAWEDAQKTLSIVGEFVEENPDSAASSVKKIKRIYDFSSLKADTVVREVDAFYGDSDNQKEPLSRAVTAARARLR